MGTNALNGGDDRTRDAARFDEREQRALLTLQVERAYLEVLYTGRIGEWWDPRYTANAETFEGVTIEPRVGGRVFATHGDSGRGDWGEVLVWEPGRRLVYTSTLAQSPEHPSEIAVDFEPDGPGCLVEFAHGG